MKLFAVALVLLFAGPLPAQTGVRPPKGWSLGVWAGGAAFTDFQRSSVSEAGLTRTGQTMEREFDRTVGAQTSGLLAATVAYWPTGNWGFRTRAAYAPSRFETVIPQSDAEFLKMPLPAATGSEYRSLAITSLDAQVLFRLPTIRHRIMPYGILGAGAVRYSLRSGPEPVPEEAVADFKSGHQTQPAVTFGLGAMLGLRPRGWALSFELSDQISRTPVQGATEDSVEAMSSLSFTVGASWTSGN